MAGNLTRIGDVDSDYDRMITGSSDVMINGLGACRLGDINLGQRIVRNEDGSETVEITYDKMVAVSNTVFINSLGASRIGDRDDDDDTMITGSYNVFVGD